MSERSELQELANAAATQMREDYKGEQAVEIILMVQNLDEAVIIVQSPLGERRGNGLMRTMSRLTLASESKRARRARAVLTWLLVFATLCNLGLYIFGDAYWWNLVAGGFTGGLLIQHYLIRNNWPRPKLPKGTE